jgi:hypothetical protein
MIKDWKRPKGDDTTNHTLEVNIFKTDTEVLRKKYAEIIGLDDIDSLKEEEIKMLRNQLEE